MRLGRVDLNLFVVFDAIYRERSVTKVAVLLNLTQPAVSNALSRLRQTFDDPLFVRTPEGMSPTPVADSVVGDVRQALDLLGRSVGANARFAPETSEKVFRLGMNDLAEALLLPALQASLAAAAPRASISSYYPGREAAVEALKAGVGDLLVDVAELNARDLGHCRLGVLPYVVALRPGHPLLGAGVSLDDYLAAEHVHVSSRQRGRGHTDVALHALGQRRRVSLRVQHYLVAARVVAQTDLLWTAPQALVAGLPLVQLPLPFAVEPLRWNLYWPKGADGDPASQWLRALVLGSAEGLGPS